MLYPAVGWMRGGGKAQGYVLDVQFLCEAAGFIQEYVAGLVVLERKSAKTAEGRGGEIMTENRMLDLRQRERADCLTVIHGNEAVDGMPVHLVDEIHPRVDAGVTEFGFKRRGVESVYAFDVHWSSSM